MIAGTVNNYLDAIIELPVYDIRGQLQSVSTVVDTGFDGGMTLPASSIKALGLPFRRSSLTLLADGSESEFDIYEAIVEWDGQPRQILVDTAETNPLIGMALLEDYELRVQVRPGGRVLITALPDALGKEAAPDVA
jgi:clan AA aspartic protease